jgi:hypothetical protein
VNNTAEESLLWTKVLLLSEAIDDKNHSIEDIQSLLCGLDEGFSSIFDPADNFPEFATLRLCRSIQQILCRLKESNKVAQNA